MKKTLRVLTFRFDTAQKEDGYDWDKLIEYITDKIVYLAEFLGLEVFASGHPEYYEDD